MPNKASYERGEILQDIESSKKSKGHPNVLERVSKATGKGLCC